MLEWKQWGLRFCLWEVGIGDPVSAPGMGDATAVDRVVSAWSLSPRALMLLSIGTRTA